jgi:hypothetical protein
MRPSHLPLPGFGSSPRLGSLGGCLHLAAKWDPPVVISVNPSLDARPPTPAVPQGALTCFFPCVIGLPQVYTRSASRECPLKRLRSGWVFRSCRHFVMFGPPVSLALQIVPTAVHNCDRAARAFTSEPIMLRYLCMLPICLPSEYRQLTARGLAPLKIHSLIRCSVHLAHSARTKRRENLIRPETSSRSHRRRNAAS